MKFFDLDSPAYRVGTEIADFMIITLYWIICCIPIITIGASTTSMFYVYGKKVRGEDCYITRDFFKSFKQNFKQSIPITIILLVLWSSSLFYYLFLMFYDGQGALFVQVGVRFLILEVILVSVYVFAILSRFYMKTSQIFLTAFILVNKHPLTSFTLLMTLVAGVLAFFMMPITIIMAPAIVVWILSISLQKIFKKNIEQIEPEREEEIEEVQNEQELENEKELEIEMQANQETNNTDDEDDEDKDYLKYI